MAKPCLLLLNDLHIDKDNIDKFVRNWNEALDVAAQYEVREIVIGGDVFTSRATQPLSVLKTVRECFRKAHDTVDIITVAEGNHDKVDQEDFFGYNHLFSDIEGVHVVDDYDYICLNIYDPESDVALYVMSFFPETGSFVSRYEAMVESEDIGDNDILYIHEGIHGTLGDFDIPSELPNDMFGIFSKVLVGHYHNRCKIKGTNIEYIGSSRQHSFGEDEEKGYTLLYSDGSTRFIKNKVNTRYITLSVNASDVDEGWLTQLKADDDIPYKVKVKVSCTDAESKVFDKQRLLDAGANKVELVTEKLKKVTEKPASLDEKFDKAGIEKEYLRFCNDRDIDSELGIQYLKQIQ